MKYAVSKEQRDFFQKNGFITFANLFNESQLDQLKQEIDKALSVRLQVQPAELRRQKEGRLFLNGHDLWRASEWIKKLVLSASLTDIVGELLDAKSLRLAWDQWIPGNVASEFNDSVQWQSPASLTQISSIQRIECGVLIPLNSSQEEHADPASFLAGLSTTGHVLFIHPDFPIPFSDFQHLKKVHYYLIAYANPMSQYVQVQHDPHGHAMKQMGYIFGENLKEKWHPTAYRR